MKHVYENGAPHGTPQPAMAIELQAFAAETADDPSGGRRAGSTLASSRGNRACSTSVDMAIIVLLYHI